MHLKSLWSAGRRPVVIGLVLAFALAAVPAVMAQDAPQQPAPGRVFASDAGMVFNQILSDRTSDFEMVMGRLREALYKSEDPVRKQQAAGWKVFRSEAPQNGNVLYVFMMDPVVKGADYTVSKILTEAFPYEEVAEIFKVYSASYAPGTGQSVVNLRLVSDFTRAPMIPVPNPQQ